MATKDPKDVVSLGIDLPVDDAIDDLTRLGKDGSRALKLIDKTAKAYGKTQEKVRKGVVGSSGLLQGVKRLVNAYQDYGKKVTRWNTVIAREQTKLAKASDNEREGIQKKIEDLKQLRKERMKDMKHEHGRGAMAALGGAKKMGAAGMKSGKGFFKSGASLFKKDFEGAAEHAAKAIGDAMSSNKTLGKGVKKAGNIFWKYGDKKLADAHKKWGMGGIKGKVGAVKDTGLAAGAGALAGMSKVIGPLLSMLGKLGPIISMAAGAFGAIVKLMIDAEAQAKEMNKQILQASGSANQFYKFSQKGDVALQDMGDMMKDIRDDATSLDNIKWGINKEDHMAVLTSLAQEGVALDELGQQFKAVGDDADLASVHAKSFGGVVQTAVAYSRQFGVSLQEVSQFQGEMMTDMGESLAGVQKAFHMMTAGAADSGIATNKFFGIIRGVSADLNLYNSRLEDTVHTLTMLGKVMSPRNAAKFMSVATQGLRGMGRVERLKMNIMGGGKMGKAVTRDLARKSGGVAEQINATGGKVKKEDILDPSKKLSDLMEGVPEKMQGEFKEAIISMRTDQKMNKKGVFGSSMAGRNLGPGAALQAMKNSLNVTGKGKLADRRGDVSTEMLAEANGISEEQLDQMTKFEASIDDQRDTLKNQLKKGGAEAQKASDALKKAGIDASQIDTADYDQILDTLDETQKKSLQDAGKEINYAKQTSQYTSTITQKLDQLMDWLMNQLFNIMSDVYDAISDIADRLLVGNSDARKMTKLQIHAQKSGNKELSALAAKATSPEELHQLILSSQTAKGQEKAAYDTPGAVDDLLKKQADLQDKLSKAQTDDEKKKLGEELAVVQKSRDAAIKQRTNMSNAIDANLGGPQSGLGSIGRNGRRQDAFAEAAKHITDKKGNEVGLTEAKVGAVKEALDQGKSLEKAMDQANISADHQSAILDKIRLSLSTEQLMDVTAAATEKAAGPNVSPAAVDAVHDALDVSSQAGGAPPPPPKPPGGGPPPAVAQAQTADATKTMASNSDDALEQASDMVGTLDGIQHTLMQKGIKINKSFLHSEFWKMGEDAVLDATRTALLEYFMYKDLKPDAVAKGLKEGRFNASNLGSTLVKRATATGKGPDINKAQANATGGVVAKPAPGEFLASVQPGESIVPRGGAGSGTLTIPINVNGPGGHELAGMMKSAAMGVVAEWQRKQKYT
jgi:archaellum component FlaC